MCRRLVHSRRETLLVLPGLAENAIAEHNKQ